MRLTRGAQALLLAVVAAARSAAAQGDPAEGGGSFHCDLQTTYRQEGKTWGVHVEGSTNLPEGAQMLVSLVYGGEPIQSSWTRVFVTGPGFSRDLGPFDVRPFSGLYTVRFTCELARQDPGPYLVLQDVGDLEFEAGVYVGSKEQELTEDKAFLDWVKAVQTSVRDHRTRVREVFKAAEQKTEFRTSEGGFDAFACTRWMDQWLATAKQINRGADAFSTSAFGTKDPGTHRITSGAVTATIEEGCARATKCFSANGVPPPRHINTGGSIIVDTEKLVPLEKELDLERIVTEIAVRVAALEKEIKELHEHKDR